jgi:ribosomal protein S18 acetylase RimI-like enzyme
LPNLLRVWNVTANFNENEYYISSIAAYPEFRGHGFGSLLLTKVEEIAKENNLEKLSLDVEPKSVILKSKFSFYRMVKELK